MGSGQKCLTTHSLAIGYSLEGCGCIRPVLVIETVIVKLMHNIEKPVWLHPVSCFQYLNGDPKSSPGHLRCQCD